MDQNQNHEMKTIQNAVGMTVTLISFGMLFATLFLGYFLVRFNSPVWPPVEIENMPQLIPFLSTLIMALSSVTYYLLEKKTGNKKLTWLCTFVLGILFLVLQWQLWAALKSSGILVSGGMVPSLVYGFTWLHAAHIVLGLLGLLWIGYFVVLNPAGLSEFKLINVGKFWHFLGVVWLLIYLMIFVL